MQNRFGIDTTSVKHRIMGEPDVQRHIRQFTSPRLLARAVPPSRPDAASVVAYRARNRATAGHKTARSQLGA
jgi:hypothetical protein